MVSVVKNFSPLLIICLIAYVLYLKSNTYMTEIHQLETYKRGTVVDTNDGHEAALTLSGGNIKRFIIDNEGNEVPVFDENTLYPKPGGGYCDMTSIKDKEEYFQALEKVRVACKDMRRLGSYSICLDSFKKKNNCLVLSFGINYSFAYEDALVDLLGCQAYSFDPTMDKNSIPHVRKNGKDRFFELGLSSYKGVKTITYKNRKNRVCEMDRYVNIVKMLDVADKEIDFFKIDIEGSELDFFLDTASNHPELLENFKQVHFEIHSLERYDFHSGNSNYTTEFDMMKIVNLLHCHGFGLSFTKMNPNRKYRFMYNGKERTCCYETTWLRV